MNECVNLKNLSSLGNTYTKSDIETLHNLKRIYSKYDKYESNDKCLIEDLFKNNKLEYVCVHDWNSNSNIVKSIALSHNIANLRYMDIDQRKARYDIKLNISSEYPEHLRAYYVITNKKQIYKDPDDIKYGELEGPQELVSKMEKQLVHKLEKN